MGLRASLSSFALLASAVSACSLLAPIGDLRQGQDASVEASTAPDGGDAGGADAADAAAPDGGGDANPCANALLCDDFDHLDASFPKWTKTNLQNGGALTIGTMAPFSAPGFLSASVPTPQSAADHATAGLQKDLGVQTSLRLTARVRLPKRPAGGYVQFHEVYSIGNPAYGVYLESDGFGDRVAEEYFDGNAFQRETAPLGATLQAGTWTLVTTIVDLAGKQVQVSFEGAVVCTMPLKHVPSSLPPLRVQFGIAYAEPAAAAVPVDVDDVVVQ